MGKSYIQVMWNNTLLKKKKNKLTVKHTHIKNLKLQVVQVFNLNLLLKLFFCLLIISGNNLSHKICCENIMDIIFFSKDDNFKKKILC